MTTNDSRAEGIEISTEAVGAVARHLYGHDGYDALGEDQVKVAYRKQATALLQVANDANR